ncbi:hypothetical protein KKG85_01810 [Patescibacteria group bacterium]|nr:hypothetical protein [Patescibacteria group bacterium]MBU2579885.1 hypothetical protein [Patescibacteria group bacterium]
MDFDNTDYKKILEKYGLDPSEKEIIEIAKNIQDIANVFVQFAKNKNQTNLESTENSQLEHKKKNMKI